MGNNLKPVGSEKLQGMEKIQRIMEIARYKENIPNPINEDKSTEYTKVLANGRTYKIDKERNGYVLKSSINESSNEFDYMEPMKNRKYYPSYSQALKRLNLVAKEVNVNEGSEKNVNLFYENENAATKYILKMKSGETDEQVAPSPAPAPAPAPAPSPAPAPAPTPAPEEMPEPAPEDMDFGGDMEDDDNEEVTLKTIQKLTGKLAQKLRAFQETEEGQDMTSKDSKYVINSILSAIDLESLDDEDKEEIVNKIEGTEEEGMGDFNPDDMGDDEPDFGGDEMGGEEPIAAPDGEMAEGFDDFDIKSKFSDFDDDEFSEIDLEKDFDFKPRHSKHRSLNHPDIDSKHSGHIEDMIEGIFTESKVDKIIEGYFKLDDKEKKLLESKKRQSKLVTESKKVKINKIKQLSESISQEVGARKLIEKYPNAKLVGKTNRQNLVFEMNDEQLRVNTKGQII